MGESAGAAHVVSAVTMPRFRLAGGVRSSRCGAPVWVTNADLEFRAKKQLGLPTPDPLNDAILELDSGRLGSNVMP